MGFCQIGFKISEGLFFSPRARLGLSESQSDNHGEDGRAFAGRRQRVYSADSASTRSKSLGPGSESAKVSDGACAGPASGRP